jgi:hypothetical protein
MQVSFKAIMTALNIFGKFEQVVGALNMKLVSSYNIKIAKRLMHQADDIILFQASTGNTALRKL